MSDEAGGGMAENAEEAPEEGHPDWWDGLVYTVAHGGLLLVSYLVLQTWLSYGSSECPSRPVV